MSCPDSRLDLLKGKFSKYKGFNLDHSWQECLFLADPEKKFPSQGKLKLCSSGTALQTLGFVSSGTDLGLMLICGASFGEF